ncbi:3-hydroxy-5-methyl-1-naphthoate 3-O-methyltransferase [Diplonema papillatum]|nr:3-hydroxy-5-methyl-1-naphthoate 3-O-methyltransferase [Diplonema papillatum]|eukprot:gene13120-20255_t
MHRARAEVLGSHLQPKAANAAACRADINGIAYGFMGSAALFTALEIGIFDAIAAGKCTALALMQATGIEKPRLQTLLTALTAMELVSVDGGGKYANTAETRSFLVRSSPQFYGDYIQLQVGRQFYPKMGRLTQAMHGDAASYTEWFKDAKEAETYTMAQHNGSLATAKHLLRKIDVSDARTMLDVGGGSGAFSIEFARKHKNLRSTVLELPEVAAAGRAIVAADAPDVQERVAFRPGSALDPWNIAPGSVDVVLMSYLSGSIPAQCLPALYRQAHDVLAPGGLFVVHDFMVHNDKKGPLLASWWALEHVTVNPDGLGLYPDNVIQHKRKAGFTADPILNQELIKGLTAVVAVRK